MTPGLRTSAEVKQDLLNLPTVSFLLPGPWRVLMQLLIYECAAALARNDAYNSRDQSLLPLALRLLKAGRHAGWVIAQGYRYPPSAVMADWQQIAAWHHIAFTYLYTGWQQRLPTGQNRALPLEANTSTLAPLPVRVTENADRWLTQLARDPFDLSVTEARLGLNTIPAGIWLTP